MNTSKGKFATFDLMMNQLSNIFYMFEVYILEVI